MDITDKVFSAQDKHSFIAGEFVWSGSDYLVEPAPSFSSRSSYCFIIDLERLNNDRFYLHQSRWKPDLSMVHTLSHWNCLNRVEQTTPVHAFPSGDEAELFLMAVHLLKGKRRQ